MGTRQTVEAFVAAINNGKLDHIGALMSEDHVFTDSLGNSFAGRKQMMLGWQFYLDLFPDYHISVAGILTDQEQALLYGKAEGTLHRDGRPVPDGAWEITAAWRAVVAGSLIAEWQVFADNKPVYALIGS